jgi:hypothetical protein
MWAWTRRWTWAKTAAVFRASVHWVGETVVGLIPLVAFLIMHTFSIPPGVLVYCPTGVGHAPTFSACRYLAESVSQEICILTVVISGLALISLGKVGQGGCRPPATIFTGLLMLLAICALLAGAILYAIYGAHIDHSADGFTLLMLFVGLFSSFFIALERAILTA